MRLFEILMLFGLLACLIVHIIPANRRSRWMDFFPLAVLILALCHLLFEGYRWQMLPAYLLSGILFVIFLSSEIAQHKRLAEGKPVSLRSMPAFIKVIGMIAGIFLLLTATGLSFLMPVFDVPSPSGKFAVGTTSLHFVDSTRVEQFSDSPNDYRDLVVQAWYPAAPSIQEDRSAYMEKAPFWLNYWSLIQTHAYRDAKIASNQSTYPVLLYSHCYMCPVNQSTVLMQELASHGYVVFSVGHPYEEVATVYPDGRALYGNFDRMTAVRKQFAKSSFYSEINASVNQDEKEKIFRAYLKDAPLTDETTRIWAEDTYFVIDQLENLNVQHNIFAGKLDFDRLGAFGYSMGGAVAGQATLIDPRIKAGVNIDCVNFGDMIDSKLTKPFMFIASEAFQGANDALFAHATNEVYSVVIGGTTHQNFSDMTLQFPQLALFSVPASFEEEVGIVGPVIGTIDPRRAREITAAYILAFFDLYLRGQTVPLLEGAVPSFPEVEIKRVRNVHGIS